jgi:tRNA dimethylallyltransferase
VTGRVCALVGATAVGKSELAVSVALRIGAEVVSIDSMQVYRGLDAGTDKPTPAMRALVRHHLIDAWDPAHELTVAEFQSRARATIEEVSLRGRLPLVVGGSGLYFRAVVDDLRFPPRSDEIRGRLEQRALAEGASAMHARLAAVDPEGARRIEPGNVRRIVRALEVHELTGGSFSQQRVWRDYSSIYDLRVAGLLRPRRDLYGRLEERADRMLGRGLVEEARMRQSSGLGATARQALGYRQVLDAPQASREDLRRSIVAATKRFARRQEAWFKADPRVVWFDARETEVVDRLVAFFAAPTAHASGGVERDGTVDG